MGEIKQNLTLRGVYEKKVFALVDTGAQESFIRADIASKIGAAKVGTIDVQLADKRIYKKQPVVAFFVLIKNRFVNARATIFEMREPLILGVDFLQANSAFIDMQRDKITFNRFAPIAHRRMIKWR